MGAILSALLTQDQARPDTTLGAGDISIASDQIKEQISGLVWSKDEIQLKENTPWSEEALTLEIPGVFPREEWTLLIENQVIGVDPRDHRFTLTLPIHGDSTPIDIIAIGPQGEIEHERAVLKFPDWKKWLEVGKQITPRSSFTPSFGISSLSYYETGKPDFSEWGLSAKFSYQYRLAPPRWDLAINAFVTAIPFASSRADATARFLGVNVRTGYLTPFLPSPWSLTIGLGAYYASMFVTANLFGYSNVFGPELYPLIKYTFAKGDSASAYLKYSPITNGLSVLSLSNREFAVGGAYSHRLRNGHPLSLMLDFADLSASLPDSSGQSRGVESISVSISAGYGL